LVYLQGPDSQGDLDYEKEGDSYRELVTLLKDKSPKFAEMIDKQVSNLSRNLSVHHKT
jgi:predicted transcriptional regulator